MKAVRAGPNSFCVLAHYAHCGVGVGPANPPKQVVSRQPRWGSKGEDSNGSIYVV